MSGSSQRAPSALPGPAIAQVNRRLGLRHGGLGRRYLRRHDRLGRAAEREWAESHCECCASSSCRNACRDLADPDLEDFSLDTEALDDDMAFSVWEEGVRFAGRASRLGLSLRALRDRLPAPAPDRRSAPCAQRPGARPPAAPSLAGSSPAAAAPRRSPAQLEADLAAHAARLSDSASDLAFLYSADFRRAWTELGAELPSMAAVLPGVDRHRGALTVALWLSPFWIRPLRDFSPGVEADGSPVSPAAAVRALIRHLFVAYPVPPFLLHAWSTDQRPELKWALWTVLLGQGGSLLRAAPRLGWTLSRQHIQHLLSAPPDLEPVGACLWAEVARQGGTRLDFDRLWRNEALRLDPTEGAEPLAPPGSPAAATAAALLTDQRLFLCDTVAWLLRHRDELSEEGCDLILEWAAHLQTEAERLRQPRFSWRGRGVAASLARAEAYQRSRHLPYGDLRWRAHGWDLELRDEEDRPWTVQELTTAQALYEEGLAQRHCVGGYALACARDQSAIFSLREAAQRRVTIELSVQDRRVLQAKGPCNRPATPREQQVLSAWLRAIGG